MHVKTKELKSLIDKQKTLQDKIAVLKGAYEGEDCYILTAGPSVKSFPSERLKVFLEDKLTIAVKQTYQLVDGVVDYHLLNAFNYQRYQYITKFDPVVMMLKTNNPLWSVPGCKSDLEFVVRKRDSSHAKSLAFTKQYDDYLLEEGDQYRPFGPGIMHELGIFLPVLLGVKRVFVLGWDLGAPKTDKIERFYEKTSFFSMQRERLMSKSLGLYNKIYIRLENAFRLLMFLLGREVIINIPGVAKGEAGFIADSTLEMYEWLERKGVELYVVSDRSMLHESIPRVELDI